MSIKKIIVIKLSGGLGNQLFQYLYGVSNFNSDETDLIFDISECLNPDNPRKFVLDQLGISGNFALGEFSTYYDNRIEYACLDNIRWQSKSSLLGEFKKLDGQVIREESFVSQNDNSSKATFYLGYWQSPQEWHREALALPRVYKEMCHSVQMKKVDELISSSISINSLTCAVHIRGEDYLSLKDYHGVCGSQYYKSALSKFPGFKFHIFTNDIEYAKSILPKNIDCIFINDLVDDDLKEFLLLTRYSNYIIANSSYSYLAACLRDSEHSPPNVIAPYPWYSFFKDGPFLDASWEKLNRSTGNSYNEDLELINDIKVSVVVPVHGRPEHLESLIKSVLNQTRIPNEIIFSENNATDKVKNEVNRLISLHPIIRKVESERPSLSLARNIAIKSASGDLIAFLDDDDIWVKEKLELQVKNIVLMGAVGISSNYYEFNDSEKIIFESKVSLPGSKSWLELLSDQNFFSGGSAAMIRSEVFDRIGYFDESMPACEDHEFWWRMAANGEPLVYLDDILVGVRKNNKNMSDNSTLMLRGNLIFFSKILGKKGMSEEYINNYAIKIRHQINLIFSPELFSKIPESGTPNLFKAISTYWHLRVWNHLLRLKISSYLYNLSRNDPGYLEEKLIKKPILGAVVYLLRALFILIVVAPIEVMFLFAAMLKKVLRLI